MDFYFQVGPGKSYEIVFRRYQQITEYWKCLPSLYDSSHLCEHRHQGLLVHMNLHY